MARNTAPNMRAFLSRDDTVSLFGGGEICGVIPMVAAVGDSAVESSAALLLL